MSSLPRWSPTRDEPATQLRGVLLCLPIPVLPNQLIPKRESSARPSSGGGAGVGGFLGGLGRHLLAATEQASCLLNDCGIGAPPRPAGGKGEGDWTLEWMKSYAPALADLRLWEMSLPGTHDSGTAKMVSEEPVMVACVGSWGQ